jgi:hypothetical protein
VQSLVALARVEICKKNLPRAQMTQSSFGPMMVVEGMVAGGSDALLINACHIGGYSWLRAAA